MRRYNIFFLNCDFSCWEMIQSNERGMQDVRRWWHKNITIVTGHYEEYFGYKQFSKVFNLHILTIENKVSSLTCITPSCDVTLVSRFELIFLWHTGRHHKVIQDDIVTRRRLEFDDSDVIDVRYTFDVIAVDVDAVDGELLFRSFIYRPVLFSEDYDDVIPIPARKRNKKTSVNTSVHTIGIIMEVEIDASTLYNTIYTCRPMYKTNQWKVKFISLTINETCSHKTRTKSP